MSNDMFVYKFYQMDPETEDMLPDGHHLANGMVVLLGTSNFRVSIQDNMDEWELARARENNRWCKISNVTVEGTREGRNIVSFIGTYEDGTKTKRTYDTSYSWFVKTDSLSEAMHLYANRYGMVHSMIAETLKATPPSPDYFDLQVEEITHQIMRLFS